MNKFRLRFKLFHHFEVILVKNAWLDINKLWLDVSQKFEEASQIVQFLNTLSQESLDAIGIKDMIAMILDIERMNVKEELILVT